MKKKKINQGDLLYHAVHGLCRVADVEEGDTAGETYYALVPKLRKTLSVRYVMSSADIENSGFHKLISVKEANKILEYFKAGVPEANAKDRVPGTFAVETQTWALAKEILLGCHEEWQSKDQRRRQKMERSARGLVEELAFVLGESKEEVAAKVKKNLGSSSKLHAAIAVALDLAAKD